MMKADKILFPVDLSEASPRMVSHVLTMAQKFDAEIHLLFVARVFDHLQTIYVPHPSIRQFEQDLLAGAQKALEEFRQQYFSAYARVKTCVRSGDVAEEILNYIPANQIDLLIIATHGRKGLERVVFGSVAQRVVRHSPVPALIVNPYRVA